MLLPVSSFSVILNFNKIAIEIFIGYTELRSSNNLCNSVYHKDHAPESGLQLSWGELFIFHLSFKGGRFVSPSYC